MPSVSYFTVGSNKLPEAKAFYDALLGAIGFATVMEHPKGGRLYGAKNGGLFGVMAPYDDNAACVGNGNMGGFKFDTTEEVDAFHAKALSLGGTCEGAPGQRLPHAYFAYFRDLDGNKLCGYKLG
jgi:catechol 2,3-dioxygenase-like lactoylglutathione lyase family enzyme